jgi:integrase
VSYLYKRPGSRFWWTKFEHAGEPHRYSTGQVDRREAAKEARRIRVEVETRIGPGGRQVGLAMEYLEALDIKRAEDKGLGVRRGETLEHQWAHLYAHLGGARRDATTLHAADVPDYEGRRRAEGARGQTVRREIQSLKRGIRLAVGAGKLRASPIDWDAVERIESDPPLEAQASKEWSQRDVERVLAKLSKKAVTAGYRQGLRFAQLVGLRYEELQRYQRSTWLNERSLHVPAIGGSKTKDPREIYLGPEALKLARNNEHFRMARPHYALKLASKKAGFAKVLTPRDLRAFFITQVAKINLMAAQKLAGHKSIATTSRYLHLDKASIRQAALKAAKAMV